METQIASGAQIIEVKMDVPSGVSSLSGNKICGGAVCDFSDAKTSSKDAKERSASMRKLLTAVILCIIFMTVEVIGGIEANSLAILTDAAHLLSDVAAFAISLFSLWAAGWEATPRQSYGFFRIEILGALVSIQMIWLLAGILVYEALVRIINDNGEVQGKLMFIVSAFGLLVNIIMAVMLGHDHGHSHGHAGHSHSHAKAGHDHAHDDASHDNDHEHDAGHNYHHGISVTTHHHHHHHHHGIRDDKSDDQHVPLLKAGHDHVHDDASHVHDHEHDAGHNHHHGISVTTDHHHHHHHHGIRDGKSDDQHVPLLKDFENPGVETTKKRQRNINVHSAYLHVLGDSIQSIGVMIGGAIIWYKPEWKIIDLICTLIFSVIVLITTIKMLRNILEVLMESTPREIDATKLERGLCRMEDVVAIHELHIWAITVGKVLLACHVTITPEADADLVLDGVIGYIRREYNISHVTIQIERQ